MVNKLFKRTEFASNVLTLMTGTAIAQAIPIAISPILTRIYSPDDFGLLGVYMAVVSIISVIAAARYELAIMLPKSDEDAFNILTLSILITVITSIIVFIVILIFHNQFIEYFVNKIKNIDRKEIGIVLYLIPVSILFVSSFQIFNYWSTRQKTFKINAAGRISQSSVYSLGALGIGLNSAVSSGLIIGNVLGYFTSFFVLLAGSFKSLKKLSFSISKQRIVENAKKYKLFPIINTPHALLGSLQEHGIIFFITYFFSSFIVGFYSFTYRIMNLPMGLIGASLNQVFYQKASLLYNNGESLQPVLKKLYLRSFLIGLPIFLFIFITAPTLFSLVFGEKWLYAGYIARIVTPWIFLNFITSPVASIALITQNQKKAMLIAVVDFSIRCTSIIIGGITGSFETALYLMTAGCCCLLLYALYWYYKIAGER